MKPQENFGTTDDAPSMEMQMKYLRERVKIENLRAELAEAVARQTEASFREMEAIYKMAQISARMQPNKAEEPTSDTTDKEG